MSLSIVAYQTWQHLLPRKKSIYMALQDEPRLSFFKDQAGADVSKRMAADSVKENIASLFGSSAEITDGEVLVHSIT